MGRKKTPSPVGFLQDMKDVKCRKRDVGCAKYGSLTSEVDAQEKLVKSTIEKAQSMIQSLSFSSPRSKMPKGSAISKTLISAQPSRSSLPGTQDIIPYQSKILDQMVNVSSESKNLDQRVKLPLLHVIENQEFAEEKGSTIDSCMVKTTQCVHEVIDLVEDDEEEEINMDISPAINDEVEQKDKSGTLLLPGTFIEDNREGDNTRCTQREVGTQKPSFEEQNAAAIASACEVFSCLLRKAVNCRIVIRLSDMGLQDPGLQDDCHTSEVMMDREENKGTAQEVCLSQGNEIQNSDLPDVHMKQLGFCIEDKEQEKMPESDLIEDFLNPTLQDEGEDGLKKLWEDMDIALACLNDEEREPDVHTVADEECDHNFFLKQDVGLVCESCGLVGRRIETWFDLKWPNAKRRKNRTRETLEDVNVLETFSRQKNLDGQRDLEVAVVSTTCPSFLKVQPHYIDKMHQHQKDGFCFLEKNLAGKEPSGCILAHAPGTGKTFLIISFLQSFLEAFPDQRPLILAPKIMLGVWVNEFCKWKVDNIPVLNIYDTCSMPMQLAMSQDYNDGQLNKIRCSQHQILEKWKAQKSILLMSYSQFSALVNDHRNNPVSTEIRSTLLHVPGLLILDEGHNPRNSDTKILEGLLQVHTKRRVLLTGTIFQNNFNELFNLFHLARPEFLDGLLDPAVVAAASSTSPRLMGSKLSKRRSSKEKKERKLFKNLGEKIMYGFQEERNQAIALLHRLSEPFVHWYKGQVLQDLPGLIDFTVMLNLNTVQQEALAVLQRKEKESEHFSSIAIEHSMALVCIHPSLLKVATCPEQQGLDKMEEVLVASENEGCAQVWQDNDKDPRSGVKTKFVMDVLRLCVASREKALIFCRYLDPLTLISEILQKEWRWNMDAEMVRITGHTSMEDREIIIENFNQNPKVRVLFASIMTCGEGICLTGASRVILLDVHWNPAITRQAISRAFRIGQNRRVFVYRLVCAGTIEEETHLKAREKEWIAKSICEGCEAGDYEAYLHEVDPRQEDQFFESVELRQNVNRCYQCCFL